MRIPVIGNSKPPRAGNFQQFSAIPAGLAAPSSPALRAKAAPSAPRRASSGGGGGSRNNSPSHSSSGGGRSASISRSSNSSSGGRGASAPATTVATPQPMSISDWLNGDTTYQSQIAQLRKAYNDYMASQNNDKTQYQNQYGLNVKNLGQDRTQAFDGLLNDYAGRGLLNSGVYGKAYSDLQSDYDTRQTQLDTQRNSYLADLATNLTNFQGDQATATTTAKQDAIARRAAKYGG